MVETPGDKLTRDEEKLMRELRDQLLRQRPRDDKHRRLYQGTAPVENMGISLPPEAEAFAFYPNWVRSYVKIVEERQDVRLLVRDDVTDEDPRLRRVWKQNQLELHSHRFHTDLLVYGRAVLSVSRGMSGSPRIVVEDPRAMAVKSDPITGETVAALRVYSEEAPDTGFTSEVYALYTPDEIILVRPGAAHAEVTQRVRHGLGRVPVIVSRLIADSGDTQGEPLGKDLFKLVDLAGRVMLNLQLAMETVGAPQKIAIGVKKEDFLDEAGNFDAEGWSTYYGSIWAVSSDTAKITQLPGADLSQFVKIIEMITHQAAGLTGLSSRQLGQSTVNPASEGALRAEESRLIKQVERVNTAAGAAWSWALGIALRIFEGVWDDGTIEVVWQDPATPTEAQRADRLQKNTGGKPIMSRRGAIEEMGWSEARKQKELEWLAEEDAAEFGYTAIDPEVSTYDDPGRD